MKGRSRTRSLMAAGLAALVLGAQGNAQAGAPGDAGQVNASRINKDRGGVTAKGHDVSRGYTADVDPAAWRIVDGRLLLNYSPEARRLFERDTPGNLQKADSNWPALSRSNKEDGVPR